MPSTVHTSSPVSAHDEIAAPEAPATPTPADATAEAAADADAAAYVEAFELSRDDVPMLRDEVHLPGVRRETFAPAALFRLNAVPRDDVDPFDDTLFLVEKRVERIAKDGIHLGGQIFFDERLESLVTGPEGTPRRKLVMRYDEAQLARGVLEEVCVGERDSVGRWVELCRCPTRETYLTRTDPAVRTQNRIAYRRGLEANTALAQATLTEVRSGTAARVRREDEHAAREARRQKMKFTPRVAEPRYADEEQHAARQRMTALTKQLGPSARGRAAGKVAADSSTRASAPTTTPLAGAADRSAQQNGYDAGAVGDAMRAPTLDGTAGGAARPRRPRTSARKTARESARTSTQDQLLNGGTGLLPLRDVEGGDASPPAFADPRPPREPAQPVSLAARQAKLAAMLGGRTGFAGGPPGKTGR